MVTSANNSFHTFCKDQNKKELKFQRLCVFIVVCFKDKFANKLRGRNRHCSKEKEGSHWRGCQGADIKEQEQVTAVWGEETHHPWREFEKGGQETARQR